MLIHHQNRLKPGLLHFVVLTMIFGSLCQAQRQGYVYASNESLNTVDVIRASDHVRIASIPTVTTPYGLAATSDGKRIYASSYDSRTISAFDTETNALVSTLTFGSELREIALTPDERFLYVPDYYQNVVHVVSTHNNTVVQDIPVGLNPHMVAFGRSGRYAYVTNEGGSSVSVIDTQTRAAISSILVGQTPIGIAASPDTETIYVANFSAAEVSYISVKSQAVIATVSLPSNPYALAVSPDGKFIYVAASNPVSGYVISAASQSIVGTFPVGTQPRNIIVTPDGDTIYETNFDSSDMYAVNAHTYQLEYVKTLGNLDGVAFSGAAKPIVEDYRFQTIDFPGAIETEVAQSNDAGYAVGWYIDQTHVNHGFLYHQGHFTSYDFPGSKNTKLLGINARNHAVGLYTNAQGYIEGFELKNGVGSNVYVQVMSGGQSYMVPSNEVDGIDDEGNMVGVYWSWVDSLNHGFLLSGNRQTSFDYPDAPYTSASGVVGDVVIGWFVDSASHAHGYFWHDGDFSKFDFPGASVAPDGSIGYTLGSKINPSFKLAGYWGTATSYNHGFLIDGQDRKMISFDFPEAVSTTNHGISNGGTIAGSYLLNNVTHGFAAVPRATKQAE
jgi:YVTN family beta-propeller protein